MKKVRLINLKKEDMNSKTKLTTLRFIGYLAVSCASIAIPMLVYLITQDVKIAGIYVFIEWLSKVFFYAIGGVFLSKYTLKKSMIKADLLRIFGYSILLIAYLYSNKVLLLPGIIMIQVGNGISNLIYERSVFLLWEDRLKGYSSLIKLDYLAVAIAVIFGMIANHIFPLIMFSFFIMCVNFYINLKKGEDIFPCQEIKEVSYCNILNTTLLNFKDILTNKNIVYLIVFSLCCSTLLNMIFSSMSFFIENFDLDLSKNIRFISFLIAIKAIVSSFSLHFFSYLKDKNIIKDYHYLLSGTSLWFLSLFGVLVTKSLAIFVISIFLGSMANSLITVWIRNHRIKYLDENKRNEQISVIIALECCSYVMSGLFLSLSKNYLSLMIIINIFLVILLLKLIIKKYKILS